jgi:hypothetical protein
VFAINAQSSSGQIRADMHLPADAPPDSRKEEATVWSN